MRVRLQGVQACKKLYYYPPKLAILLTSPVLVVGQEVEERRYFEYCQKTESRSYLSSKAFCTGGNCRTEVGA